MKKDRSRRPLVAIGLVLALSATTFTDLPGRGIRPVDFLKIFGVGMLTGVFITSAAQMIREKREKQQKESSKSEV